MKVTLRSDDAPDVMIQANEFVRLQRLDQHIRTLQVARRWLKREMRLKQEREARADEAAKAQPAAQQRAAV